MSVKLEIIGKTFGFHGQDITITNVIDNSVVFNYETNGEEDLIEIEELIEQDEEAEIYVSNINTNFKRPKGTGVKIIFENKVGEIIEECDDGYSVYFEETNEQYSVSKADLEEDNKNLK